MKKMDVRVRKTYQMLGEALSELLKEKSFEDLTVLEICEKAGIHRATFYKHFVDKYDFLNKYLTVSIDEMSFGKLEPSVSPDAYRRNVNRIISNVMAYVSANSELLHTLHSEHYSSVFFDILSGAVCAFMQERMSANPRIRKALGNQLPMIAHYYAGAAVNLIKWWSKGDDTCSAQEFLEFVQPRIREFTEYLSEKMKT